MTSATCSSVQNTICVGDKHQATHCCTVSASPCRADTEAVPKPVSRHWSCRSCPSLLVWLLADGLKLLTDASMLATAADRPSMLLLSCRAVSSESSDGCKRRFLEG